MLASPSTATDMKSNSVFTMKRRTWCTVRILHSFCTSLECHSTNQKIVHLQQQAIAEMCSAAQQQPVYLCTPSSLDYAEGEVCAVRKLVIISIYILSVYSPFSNRVGLPLHNIHIPSSFTSIMHIFLSISSSAISASTL